MIKGKKRNFISYEEILGKTNGGYDIVMAYEGQVKKKMRRPWGKDNHPSFGFFEDRGIWKWKDGATEESGTAIEYIMKKFGLTFEEGIEKIKYDFGWSETKVNVKPISITWTKKETKETNITFTSCHFTKKHHAFWNIAGVQEADCRKMECWALKDFVMNNQIFKLKKDEVGFAFYAPEEDKCKIYLPDRPKDERFWNSASYFYLWNFRNVGNCNDLIIQKSPKDMVVTSVITPCVIATQAEATKIFNPEVVSRINTVAKNVWVFYGSDPDGVAKCKKITSEFNWKYINTPKKYLPDINDTYGMAASMGLKAVEQFMKSKKFPI